MADELNIEQIVGADKATSRLVDTMTAAGVPLQNILELLNRFGDTLKRNGEITDKQTDKLGLFAVAINQVKSQNEAFTRGVDFSGFQSQMQSVLSRINGTGEGLKRLASLTGAVQAAGEQEWAFIKRVKEAASALAVNADNALRLEKGFLALAADTGNLGDVMAAAGGNMANMNDMMAAQGEVMKTTQTATKLSEKEIQEHYAALLKLPGAYQEVVRIGSDANDNVSLLTATIQAAHGTHRSYNEILRDMATAYTNYGLKGEDALKFTVRMTEVANNNNVQFDILHNQLTTIASSFRGVADANGIANEKMADGAASIMNNLIPGLKATGATAEQSAEMITKMTSQIGNMNIAQKAFLSAQTGGPGGLMGAFQIDKMLREGDIEGVFKKVQDQMQRQLGSIVTLDEASKSPAAAAQLARQTAMLRQGPLGAMVKSDQDAYRMLEAMKSGTGPTKELRDSIVKDTMEAGATQEQRQSLQIVSEFKDLFVQADVLGGMTALKTILNAGGLGPNSTEAQRNQLDSARERAREAAIRGGEYATRFASATAGGENKGAELSGIMAEETAKSKQEIIETLKKIPKAFKAGSDALIELVSNDGSSDDMMKVYYDEMTKSRARVSQFMKENRTEEAEAEQARQKEFHKLAQRAMYITPVRSAMMAERDNIMEEVDPSKGIIKKRDVNKETQAELARAFGITRRDSMSVVARQAANRTDAQGRPGIAAGEGEGEENKVIHIKVSAICKGCENEITTSTHTRAVAPAAAISPS